MIYRKGDYVKMRDHVPLKKGWNSIHPLPDEFIKHEGTVMCVKSVIVPRNADQLGHPHYKYVMEGCSYEWYSFHIDCLSSLMLEENARKIGSMSPDELHDVLFPADSMINIIKE